MASTESIMIQQPIFIVGPGRSGTTLLRSLLSAHSRIAVTPETHFMARADQWGLQRGAPDDFEAFWADYTSWVRFRDMGIDADRCRELIELQGEHTFKAIFRAVLTAYAEMAGKPRIGEKTPGHSRYLPYLLDWFPDAKILVTQRDPRAVVASQMNTHYVKKRLTPRSLRDGLIDGSRIQQIAFYGANWANVFEQRLPPWRNDPRFHTVKYENLVDNVEHETRAICSFLGETYDPAMVAGRSEASVPMPAGHVADEQLQWRSEHHARSLAPVSADSLDKWKQQLTPREVAMIEGRCGKTMRQLGYALSLPAARRSIGSMQLRAVRAGEALEIRSRAAAKFVLKPPYHLARRVPPWLAAKLSRAVERGLPCRWVGYRCMVRQTVQAYFERHGKASGAGRYETIHAQDVAENPLPCNITSRDQLPRDRGWWGYSFHDVPERTSGETFIATIPDCLIVWYRDPAKGNDFYPAIVSGDGRALDLREVRFRPLHAAALRRSPRPARLKKATWFIERVYDNHSHWLTAHLPKLLLLRERGLLGNLLMPPQRTAAIDGSLQMLGLDPQAFATFDYDRPLRVDELTIMGTDRFRPQLLQMVPAAFGSLDVPPPQRRILISRAGAKRRRLLNEDEVWAVLEPAGFERVRMEDLSFQEQVELMQQTKVLCAPHGAGLTNMMFCPPGAHVVEMADLSFPNPNFYAVASAMRHHYWLLPAESVGDCHPLEKDLRIDPSLVSDVLRSLDAAPPTPSPASGPTSAASTT